MKDNKVKAEEVFGTVSDFHGAFGTAADQQREIPAIPKKDVPRWHDSCFDGKDVKTEPVKEAELSTHF